jgi:hypothetical protein
LGIREEFASVGGGGGYWTRDTTASDRLFPTNLADKVIVGDSTSDLTGSLLQITQSDASKPAVSFNRPFIVAIDDNHSTYDPAFNLSSTDALMPEVYFQLENFAGDKWVFDVTGGGDFRFQFRNNYDALTFYADASRVDFGLAISGILCDSTSNYYHSVKPNERQLIANDGASVSLSWSAGAPVLPDYTAVLSPTEGMIAFDFTAHTLKYYNGTIWV